MKLFEKISNKKYLIAIIFTAILFIGLISFLIIQNYTQAKIAHTENLSAILPDNAKQNILINGTPINIKIPKIQVDAFIEKLGLTPLGELEAPLGPSNAGWWKDGPIPGAIGSAVIDGHSGWKNDTPAVFDNLSKLEKGDKIYITNSTGITTTFIVTKVAIYGKNDKALEVFISNDNKSHLNLITCTGVWNNVAKGRESRLVVFADKE